MAIGQTWRFGTTEQNVFWLTAWAKAFGIEVDTEVADLADRVEACEQQPYEIKLVQTETGYTITNAATSLTEYIEQYLGGFGLDNINTLIDYAGVLGYDVSPDLTGSMGVVKTFGLKQNYHVDPIPENLIAVLEYAEAVNRFPVLIYHPAGSIGNALDMSILHEMFKPEEIVHVSLDGQITARPDELKDVKVIYVEKFPKRPILERIPLLVTFQELLYGSNKQTWLGAAERIIYMCASKLRK